MEQLKVRKKGVIIFNSILYLVFSFLFVYLQFAYRSHVSPFSTLYLQKSIELFWYIGIAVLLSTITLWLHYRFCHWAFAVTTSLVGYKILEGLFIEFNKMIVVTLFFYIVISYFLFELLREHLGSARLNANYLGNDLFYPLLKEMKCLIKTDMEEVGGVLTNWDEDGCFVKLDSPSKYKLKKLHLTVHFQGRVFVEEGEVVAHSTELNGIGIKLKKSTKGLNTFNWDEFTALVNELGFVPKRLR